MAPLFFNLQFTVFDLHNYDDNKNFSFLENDVQTLIKIKIYT